MDRRTRGLWLRTIASLGMLALLLPRVHVGSLLPAWDLSTGLWLGAAVVVTGIGVVASALRWRAVLAALGLPARLGTVLHHVLAGLFVGNFLPSTIGGDVVRARRLAAENGDGAATFASVVLERLSGMLVLPVLCLCGLAVNPGFRHLGTSSAVALALSVGTLAVLGVALVAVGHPGIGGRFTGTGRWRRFAAAVHLGTDRLRRRPQAAAGVILVGFGYQIVMVFAAFCAARALDLNHVGFTAVLAFVPAVAIAQVLPISLGGLGVREGAFVLFLHPLDVPTGRAVALGLLIYGLNLVVSLLGAPSFAVGSPPSTRAVA